jgi:hypothetical protein
LKQSDEVDLIGGRNIKTSPKFEALKLTSAKANFVE